jgi:DNA-binding MarR family transcriptional regulator
VNKVLDTLRRFQFAQSAAFHRASEALGISDAALSAIHRLVTDVDEDGVTMKDLAHNLGVSPAVLTGIVDRLEEKGWIRRRLHATDRRSTVVVPTVDEDSEVIRLLHALDEPLRRVANSISDDAATVVKSMVNAMEAELRNFDPEVALDPATDDDRQDRTG